MKAFLVSLGLEQFLGDELLLLQAVVLGLTAFFFLCSLVLSVMAMRTASSARKARLSANDLALEVRHLTAQIEKSRERKAYREVSDSDDYNPEADYYAEDDQDYAANDEAESIHTLDAAKRAASEPSALLTGFLRRR